MSFRAQKEGVRYFIPLSERRSAPSIPRGFRGNRSRQPLISNTGPIGYLPADRLLRNLLGQT